MSKSNQYKVLASLWLVFIGTAFVMGESQQLVSDYHLVKHSVTTQGYVVEKLPNEHQAVRYRYTVDGVEYEGIDAAAHKFHFVKLGDKIDVIIDQ